LSTLLLWMAVACAPKAPPASLLEPGGEGVARASGDATLLLQGFDVRWHARPHRISGLGFGASGTDDGTGQLGGTLWGRIRGGTWASGVAATDVASMQVKYGAVQASSIEVAAGRASLTLRGALSKRDSDGATAQTTVPVTVELPGVGPDAALAVWITGFDFDTTASHPNGYTPRALAVQLSAPRRDEQGDVVVDVTARLDGAPVPDRRQDLGAYASTAVVDLVVVATEHGRSQRLSVAVDEEVEAFEEGALRRAPRRLPLSSELHEGAYAAIGGLSGFSVEVDAGGPVAGRYLRALTIGVEDERLDVVRGTYEASAAVRFANNGPIPRKMRLRASVDVTLLELPAGASVRRGRWLPPPGQGAAVVYPTMERVDEP